MRFFRRLLAGLGLVALSVWTLNSSWLVFVPDDQTPALLAHRGVHQTYVGQERNNDTCTANPIAPVTHDFIENTLPSMRQAFDLGAEVVEIDIHRLSDGTFAVFHDWTLDCRTDGSGVTEEQSLATLRSLDLGYGYTPDGTTFPLRGKGVGLLPTLEEVLAANPEGRFLINLKSNRAADGTALMARVTERGQLDQVFGVYGGERPTQAALALQGDLRGYDRPSLLRCYKSYALLGWTGYVPAACRNTILAVPMDIGPYFWGWPHRFTRRMRAHGTGVILLGPYDGSGFSSGVDDAATFRKTPARFDGLIWTNRIEVIAPLLADQRSTP